MLYGDFGLVTPAGLLQLLGQEQRSVRIMAWNGASEARLDLLEGLIVWASCDDLLAEEAVYRFAAWHSGRFEVVALEHEPDVAEVVGSSEALLLEAARRRDELELLAAPAPVDRADETLADLLAACPSLAGAALIGRDGRIRDAQGLNAHALAVAATIAHGLDVAGRALGVRSSVALFVMGGQRLLLADRGTTLLLATPMPHAGLADVLAQLGAQMQAASSVA
jgi:hypothetical protein